MLGARNLEEGTQIEVLQLPLGDYDQPDGPLESSGGRFLVIDPERRDPAVLQNRLVTIVGQVIGTKVQKVEEFDYAYPYLSALFVHLWGSANEYDYGAPNPYYYQSYPAYPYYPYPYLGLYPFWYGPAGYYGAPHGGPWYAPPPRSFGAPPGGMPPPAHSPAPGPGPGGGPRRFN